MKRTSSGLHASAAHQRTSPKTNRGSGSSSSNSSLLVDLLQKESGKTERDSSPPEKKRRKYSSQGGAAHSDVESYPSVTKVANAMMAGHHSANGPTSLSGSEKLLAERLASAKQAGRIIVIFDISFINNIILYTLYHKIFLVTWQILNVYFFRLKARLSFHQNLKVRPPVGKMIEQKDLIINTGQDKQTLMQCLPFPKVAKVRDYQYHGQETVIIILKYIQNILFKIVLVTTRNV